MKNKLLFLFGLLLILTAPGCRKELDNMSFEQLKFYESDILGVVVDEEGNAVSDATVSFDGEIKKTDKNGVYIFKDVEVNSRHSVIHVIKEGYFEGIRVFSTAREAKIQLRTVLLEKRFDARFDGSTGGSVSSGNVTLEFPAQAVVVESSKALYTGEVSVAIKYLDPEDENISAKMPGNLSGINADNRLSVLTTYGMVAVEMRGSGGQKLNIATGSKVKMSADIPASLRSKAPSSIPLWYFDEESGYWKEDGQATISGNKYIGEVSHFSYWNYDAQHPSIILSGRIIDQNGNPVSGATVYVHPADHYTGGYGSTNPDGTFNGPVPKDLSLVIEIYSKSCGSARLIYTGTIGPFSSDQSIGDIEVKVLEQYICHIEANILNCAGTPLQNGYMVVGLEDGKHYIEITDGMVDAHIWFCESNKFITYYAVDSDDLVQSTPATSGILTEMDLGTLSTCADILDYLTIHVPDLSFNITVTDSHIGAHMTGKTGTLSAAGLPDFLYLYIYGRMGKDNVFEEGTYNLTFGSMEIPFATPQGKKYYKMVSGTVTITKGGGAGSTIEGNYSMIIKDIDADIVLPSPVTGSFKRIHLW